MDRFNKEHINLEIRDVTRGVSYKPPWERGDDPFDPRNEIKGEIETLNKQLQHGRKLLDELHKKVSEYNVALQKGERLKKALDREIADRQETIRRLKKMKEIEVERLITEPEPEILYNEADLVPNPIV